MSLVRLLTWLYTHLLKLYPAAYRAEYGPELQSVFRLTLQAAARQGRLAVIRLGLRELRDWPGSVLQEHWRARRRKMPHGCIEEKPLPRHELLAAMIIFLLPLLMPLFSVVATRPPWLDYFALILFWGAVLFALGLAMIKKLPRWSLSYLGFALMLGIVLGWHDRMWSWIYPFFIQSFGPRSTWSVPVQILYAGLFDFILWFSILLSAVILVNLLRWLPYTRSIWPRIRADWTQLSFMLYGGLVFYIMLTFDAYRDEDLWKGIIWLGLALGAWWYLRAKGQKQRLLTLLCGTTGAMWLVALAKWAIIPLQLWPFNYPVAPSEATRWVETSNALIGWGLILIMLTAPALLNLLPPVPGPVVSQEEVSPRA